MISHIRMSEDRKKCSDNLSQRSIYQAKVKKRKEELLKAVNYCVENNCRGSKAISSGLFTGLKCYKTIDNIIDQKSKDPHHAKEYCSVLSYEEECLLVKFLVNKARAYQPYNRKDITKYIIQLLTLRRDFNKAAKGGRKFKALSPAAHRVLERGQLSRKFFERFDQTHKKVLTKKRKGAASLKRVAACSEEVAQKHIDELAQELISAGIMTNAKQIGPGKWEGNIDTSRVYNHDETPQFLNYGVDGTARNIFYCGKGEQCSGIRAENRECVTITPMINLSGDIPMCHVIFSSQGIKSGMVPPEATAIENLLVSSTENGFITGKACLAFYKQFDKYLDQKGIKRPVVVMTDGHSSRFDLDVLRFCHEKEIFQFVSPPDTTGLLQPLDQINSKLHTTYRDTVEENLLADNHVNRETFMRILAMMWPTWASPDTIKKAFKRCGVSKEGLSIENMQQDKFQSAELVTTGCISEEPTTPSTKRNLAGIMEAESPKNAKRGTSAYWKAKFDKQLEINRRLVSEPISPAEIPELSKVTTFKLRKAKNFRITQQHGSMTACDILKVREEMEAEEKVKRDAQLKKKSLKEKDTAAFMACKDQCVCNTGEQCLAIALKQCPYCKTVLKLQCSKALCQVAAGGKPKMILSKAATANGGKKKLAKSSYKEPPQKKSRYSEIYSDSSDTDASAVTSDEESDDDHGDCSKEEVQKAMLEELWNMVSDPEKESEIKGKWYGAIYSKSNNDKKKTLIIGRALRFFRDEKDGNITHLWLDSLKPHVGNGDICDGFPTGSEGDKYPYLIEDIIAGPLEVTPVPRRPSYRIHNLHKVEEFFDLVKDKDRAGWYTVTKKSD